MQCWHAEPEKRPDIEQILAVLAELKANPELSKVVSPLFLYLEVKRTLT